MLFTKYTNGILLPRQRKKILDGKGIENVVVKNKRFSVGTIQFLLAEHHLQEWFSSRVEQVVLLEELDAREPDNLLRS